MSEAAVSADRIRLLVAQEPAGGSEAGPFGWLRRMCRVAVRTLPASGAGVSLMAGDGRQGLAAASDNTSEVIEELQFVLGEGPCMDAYSSREPVLAHDLGGPPEQRWPAYSPAARAHGVQAVFAFPLSVGSACLGVLDVYRDHPGLLSPAAFTEAQVFAEVALVRLLDEHEAVSSNLAGEDGGPDDPFAYRLEVYQASGMVMIQLGVTSEEAMLRLRAYAFAHDRRISQVASDILSRKLILVRDDE